MTRPITEKRRAQNRTAQQTYRNNLKARIQHLELMNRSLLQLVTRQASKSSPSTSTDEQGRRDGLGTPQDLPPSPASTVGRLSRSLSFSALRDMEIPTPDAQDWDLQFPEADELQKLLHRTETHPSLAPIDNAGSHTDTGLELPQDMCLPPVDEAQEPGSPGQDTPLHAMEGAGLLSCSDSTLEQGSSSILHLAVQSRQPASVALLLRYGFDIDARNIQGRTPLLIAIENDDQETVKTLLAHGADPNVRDNRQRTALEVAVMNGKNQILEILLSFGVRE